MIGKFIVGFGLASILGLAIIFNVTNPTSGGPMLILVVFVMMYFISLLITFSIIFLLRKLINRFRRVGIYKQPAGGANENGIYYYSSVIGFFPVALISLASVSALGIKEILMVLVAISIACFYIFKITH